MIISNYNKAKNQKKINLTLISLGFIVLSPWSSIITLDYFHLPLSCPELIFIFYIPFFRKNFKIPNIFKYKSTLVLLTIAFVFIIFGIMRSNPIAILSTARTWIYIILIYCIFSKSCAVRIQQYYKIALGGLLGWLTSSLYNFRSIIFMEDENITYGPMLAVSACIIYSIVKNKNILLLGFTAISIVIGFTAGLRRELAVLISSLLLGWLFIMGKHPNNIFKIIITGTIISVGIVAFYSDISLYLKENSHFLYDRVIMKTEAMFTGESEGDNDRKDNIKEYFTTSYEYFFPKGFVNKQFNSQDTDSNGLYNDLPITELTEMLGFPIAFSIIIYFIIGDLRVLRKIYRYRLSQEYFVIAGGGCVILMLLFLEGSCFTFPYCAPYTGYIIGSIQKESGMYLFKYTHNLK